MSFATDIRAALPGALHLPDAFADAFDWCEAQGQRGAFPNTDPFLSIYPLDQFQDPAASHVLFHHEAGPPLHAPPPDVVARIASIAKISGDGGTLTLWADETDMQRIVVFNHGMPYLLPDDPLIALQFLAIGYPEPGAITDPTFSAAEHAAQDMADPPLIPVAFRAFLANRFGAAVPDRASDLGITIPAADAPNPVQTWLDAAMPELEVLPIPGSSPDTPYIITRDLRATLDEESLAILRETFEYVVEEE